MPTFYELAAKHLKNALKVDLVTADGEVKIMIRYLSLKQRKPGKKTKPRVISIEFRHYRQNTNQTEWLTLLLDTRSDGRYKTQYYIRTSSIIGNGETVDLQAEPMSSIRDELAWAKATLQDHTLKCVFRESGQQIINLQSRPNHFGWQSKN